MLTVALATCQTLVPPKLTMRARTGAPAAMMVTRASIREPTLPFRICWGWRPEMANRSRVLASRSSRMPVATRIATVFRSSDHMATSPAGDSSRLIFEFR